MNKPIKKDVNYMQNLVDYSKKNLRKNYTPDSLRWALINQGHSRIEVDKAIIQAQNELVRESTKPATSTQLIQQSQPQIEIEPEQKSWWKRIFG